MTDFRPAPKWRCKYQSAIGNVRLFYIIMALSSSYGTLFPLIKVLDFEIIRPRFFNLWRFINTELRRRLGIPCDISWTFVTIASKADVASRKRIDRYGYQHTELKIEWRQISMCFQQHTTKYLVHRVKIGYLAGDTHAHAQRPKEMPIDNQ